MVHAAPAFQPAIRAMSHVDLLASFQTGYHIGVATGTTAERYSCSRNDRRYNGMLSVWLERSLMNKASLASVGHLAPVMMTPAGFTASDFNKRSGGNFQRLGPVWTRSSMDMRRSSRCASGDK